MKYVDQLKMDISKDLRTENSLTMIFESNNLKYNNFENYFFLFM